MSVSLIGAGLLPKSSIDGSNDSVSRTADDNANTESQKLKILSSDDKLTQEQVMSQIKAEYLIENNGYKADDEVVVIVGIDGDSVIETYNDGGTNAKSASDYAESFAGATQLKSISLKQNRTIERLYERNLISEVKYTYDTVMNAVAVVTKYKNLSAIENVSGVKSVALSDTYNRLSVEDSVSYNPVEIYEDTGIYKPGTVVGIDGKEHTYTGKGTTVAILDSGFDMSHRVFNDPDFDTSSLVITRDTLNKVSVETGKTLLETLNAAKTTKGLQLSQVWYSNKIPFSYDYADKDADVFPYDSEHGTHVAGIIGGNDEVIHGIAPDAQLILMKVFPDLSEGGKTEDILAALEDAVKLNVDAINMSLGSSCGFARECDEDADKENINAVYDRINESGISLITAASNSYSSGYGGAQGNTNFVTNPDSGTVGSPSTYAGALSVASISGTKSRYLIGNMSDDHSEGQIFFYKESNSISAQENHFFDELVASGALGEPDEKGNYYKTLEYVTVPGVGLNVNFASLGDRLQGKVALVKRGDNSFEEKAALAKAYGAVACIIYNNIDGDILMSMGKTEHIPTVSISKDDGEKLAALGEGTLTIASEYQAGPFMSDFSSWGPTPSLGIKPEITAHGGNIYSAVPGSYEEDGETKYRYDHLSGTSMATPNLCGIVILIRQYIKDNYKDLTDKQVKDLTNQLMMSTADIIMNEESNPYSPRKQGAGLANFAKTVKTKAYITVDGSDRTKLELKDDPMRTGVYNMAMNIVNLSDDELYYDCSLIGMTESVSSSDEKHVAETPYILGTNITVKADGKEVTGSKIKVGAKSTVKVEVVYTLDEQDKAYIESHFENGMYVEGFVKFKADGDEVDLNIPFLAFYGDWTEAPMFDVDYYEVESTAHDASLSDDDDEKIKADYYATTPYGSYYYNYMIPLGTYLYGTGSYDEIPATRERIAISDSLGTIDGIRAVAAGLLRGAKRMDYQIVDKVTGEVMWTLVDYNANKSYSNGASPVPYYEDLNISPTEIGLVNNRQYTFTMTGVLDYGSEDEQNNKNNSFSFDFYLDNEAPVLREVTYEKEYNESEEKYHYYVTMKIYDNQYAMSVTPIIFTSSSSYTFLSDYPIPINSERGKESIVTFEITDYLDAIYSDALIPNALVFSIDDYALNSNIFICQLPGTKGEFKFTKTGRENGEDLIILSAYENDIVDLKQYLYTADTTIGENRENLEYLKHLVWISSNEDIVEVSEGVIKAKASGRATVTAREKMDGKQAVIIINVKKSKNEISLSSVSADVELPDSLEELEFDRFETVFAFARAAQTSEIGKTGDVNYFSATSGVSMYPGESIKLYYKMNPWYIESEYTLAYESNNPSIASVDENGVVKALAEGEAIITLTATDKNGVVSYISATASISVKSPFVIENRTLIAYKGIGGDVVIPDDEGILYIGAYAFCLYTTDNNIKLDDDDYDANKIPDGNKLVESVEIPEGVENIQKYAFYNCTQLKKVILPSTVKYIREYAFAGAKNLKDIYTRTTQKDASGNYIISARGELGENTIVIGARAFKDCKKLDVINLAKLTSIGERAFEGCLSLKSVDLTTLRNSGKEIFKDCTALKSAKMNEYTKLSYAMFVNTGFEEITLYEKISIPEFCFANCENLKKVTLANSLETIGKGAFSQTVSLEEFNFSQKQSGELTIGEQAFYSNAALKEFTLPNGKISFGSYAFYLCENLSTIKLSENTELASSKGTVLQGTAFTNYKESNPARFIVDENNSLYSADGENSWLLSKDGKTILYAVVSEDMSDVVIDGSKYNRIAESAFAGMPVKTLAFINADNFEIGAYAFVNCENLEKIVLPENGSITIGAYAFAYAGKKTVGQNATYTELAVENLDKVTGSKGADGIGEYAFTGSGLRSATLGKGVYVGEGAFYNSMVESAVIDTDSVFGMGAFQSCTRLKSVEFIKPEAGSNGNASLGEAMFARSTALTGTIDLTDITEEVPAQLFYGCKGILAVKLGGVKKIGNSAFAECSSLSAVTFTEDGEDEALEIIGDYAFGKYTTTGGSPVFTSITLPSTLKKIGEGAFLGCEGLTEITVPEGVTFDETDITVSDEQTKIMHFTGEYVFFGCSRLAEVNLPDSVTLIGNYMFANCISIEKVNFNNVRAIGDYAFTQPLSSSSERTLKTFNFESVISIGEAAFANNELLSCEINAPLLESIGKYAFKDTNISAVNAPNLTIIDDYAFNSVALRSNNSLKQIELTDSIEKVGKAAFAGCSAFEKFIYTENGKVILTKDINDYASIENGVLYTKMPSGNYQLTCVPANWKVNGTVQRELKVKDGVYRIEFYAGSANTNIISIIFPETLKLIGNYAFYGYTGLLSEDDDVKVVFRSYEAPTLENSYDSSSELSETAAGYGLLHPYMNLFGLELSYYNFVDLAGANRSINLWVPRTLSGTTEGYDSLVYRAIFGDSAITDYSYLAMDSNMSAFIEYAKVLADIDATREFTLSDETAVSNAVKTYNAVDVEGAYNFYGKDKDKPFTEEEWNKYCEVTLKAKEIIRKLKIETMSDEVKALDQDLLNLPDKFTAADIELLYTITERLDNSQRSLYNLEKYDALIAAFGEYMNKADSEISTITDTVFNGFAKTSGGNASAGTGVSSLLAALGGIGYAILRKFH